MRALRSQTAACRIQVLDGEAVFVQTIRIMEKDHMSNINAHFLSFGQIAQAVKAVGPELTIIVEGPFGIGKTAIYNHLKREAEADPKHPLHNHIWTGILDCTQLSDGSIWMPDIDKELGVSRELPNERFGVNRNNQKGVKGARPVVIMADEIAKAPQYVKNMLAPIFYERRVGNYFLPEGSIVFGATNMAVENLGDNIQPHLRNRITTMKMRPPTMDEWVNNFAVPNKLNAELIACVHAYPRVFETFLDWEPGGKYSGEGKQAQANPYIYDPQAMSNACTTPRSLHHVSKTMDRANGVVDDDTLEAMIAGTAGAPFAKEMLAFIRYGRDIPTFEQVVKDPKGTKVPSNPTAQIVQVFQFVTQVANRAQGDSVVKYVKRMREEMQTLFANVVANSSNVSVFISVGEFAGLLAENRQFFQK